MSSSPKMRLTVAQPSRREPGHEHPVGTQGVVVECLGDNVWLVEVEVADESLEGDAWYETLEVRGYEFELISGGEIIRAPSTQTVTARPRLPSPWSDKLPVASLPPVPEAEKLAG